jgi:hypothetical protein
MEKLDRDFDWCKMKSQFDRVYLIVQANKQGILILKK